MLAPSGTASMGVANSSTVGAPISLAIARSAAASRLLDVDRVLADYSPRLRGRDRSG
jgi:hypothetical protein